MPKVVITHDTLPLILNIINTWEGTLTWALLCEQVAITLDIKDGVQRQSLSSYKDIQDSYSYRKKIIQEHASKTIKAESTDVTIAYLRKQLAFLEVELERQKNLNEAYRQRFLLWQYNAYRHSIQVTSLDEEPIDKSALKKIIDILEKPLIETKRRTGGQ